MSLPTSILGAAPRLGLLPEARSTYASEVDSLFASVIVGNELLIDGQEVSDTDLSPRNPEDVLVQGFGAKGDRVIVKLRNGNAATNDVRSAIFIEPV